MVCGLLLAEYHGNKHTSASNLPVWCSFLMVKNSFAKARKNDSNVSTNSSPESRCGGPASPASTLPMRRRALATQIAKLSIWELKLFNFSWLDKPKTLCGDCQLNPIFKGLIICTTKIQKYKTKIHPFCLFPCEWPSGYKKSGKKKRDFCPPIKSFSQNNFVGASNQKPKFGWKWKWCNFHLLWTRTKSHMP